MKKVNCLVFATLLSSTNAMANDSVYSWGSWSQGIQPAAGITATLTPPPSQLTQVDLRPNETTALTRTATALTRETITTQRITRDFIDTASTVSIAITSAANVGVTTSNTVISATGPDTGGF